jgi:hypothetical protein
MICILEDNHERVRQFRAAVAAVAPEVPLRIWRDAPPMIVDLRECLPRVALISLDHDLNRLPNDADDPGSGYDITKLLEGLSPCCPVIIHTSNVERGTWKEGSLSLGGWRYELHVKKLTPSLQFGGLVMDSGSLPPAWRPRVYVYADESRQRGPRFAVIGSIWVPDEFDEWFREKVNEVREAFGMRREMKWTKASTKTKLDAYRALVDVLFNQQFARFKCIVIDREKVDNRSYSNGDEELGFYKFYYQLLSRTLWSGCEHVIFPDQYGTRDPHRLAAVQSCCNAYARKTGSPGDGGAVVAIRPQNSKKEVIIQLCDILIGAVGYSYNGLSSGASKLSLISHIESRLGQPLNQPTQWNRSDFNIWQWQPKKRLTPLPMPTPSPQLWTRVLDQLKPRPALHAILSQGRLVAIKNKIAFVNYAPERAVFIKMMMRGGKIDHVRTALQRVAGDDMDVSFGIDA